MIEDKNIETEANDTMPQDVATDEINTEVVNNPTTEEMKTEEVATLSPEEEARQREIEEAKKDAKWYVLHTFSGYENVAKENLEIVIDKYNLQLRIFDIVIPMEDVVEEKNGKRKIVTRKLMPGYILVKMNYGDDIWHAVTRTRGITGFVGPKGRPLPMGDEEIRKMHLEKVSVVNTNLREGSKVEILDGALNGFVGTITSIDDNTGKCRVVVEMFGRETPVDVTLDQVKELV